MQSVPVIHFWQFGTNVRFLQDARVGGTIHGSGYFLDNIQKLLKRLEQLDLMVTLRAAQPLKDLQKELASTEPAARLSQIQAKNLKEATSDLRKTLEAELLGISAYTISPKRLDTQKLLHNVPSLFAPKVFDTLSSVAQYDLAEAGKCIAFERPTAAAFHLMRAAEETLRCLYCHFVKRDRIKPLLWYPMVQALQKHHKAKVHDVLLRNLDNIRLSFRNPTQHPDKVYDIQEAQDLFALCVDAINRMQRAVGAVVA